MLLNPVAGRARMGPDLACGAGFGAHMKTLKDKGVVITGAAAGIGEALAHAMAARGAKLLLADVNAERLHALRTAFRAKGVECSVMRVDVAARDDMAALADRAAQLWGGADVLVNNAGVGVVAPVETVKEADARWLFEINFWGAWYGCRAFLPQLRGRPEAALVNVSSIFAMVGVPTQSIYNASKAALRAFTDALRLELADTAVQVLCAHPGGVKTDIAKSARKGDVSLLADDPASLVALFEQLSPTLPAQAAEAICRALETGRTRLLIGSDARVADWVYRLMPARASAWFVKQMRKQRARAGRSG